MPKPLKKQLPTADGMETVSNSCTRLNYRRLRKLMAFSQQRNNASSMRRRRCWISQMSRPMFSLLSNLVWEGLVSSSNTMRCASVGSHKISLTHPFQGYKDVEDKLGDLATWLSKLKANGMTTSADVNPEEAERREHMKRFPSHSHRLAHSSQPSVVEP